MDRPICTTCIKPADNGYMRIYPDKMSHSKDVPWTYPIMEMCCDPCHGPYLFGDKARVFRKFHGRKASKMMRRG